MKFRLRIYLLWGTGYFQNSSLRLFCSMEILWNTYFQVCLRHLEIFITYKTCWNFWSPFECIGLWNTATLALFLFYTFFYLFLVFFTMSFSASVFPSTSDKLESKSATLAGSYTALNMAFQRTVKSAILPVKSMMIHSTLFLTRQRRESLFLDQFLSTWNQLSWVGR